MTDIIRGIKYLLGIKKSAMLEDVSAVWWVALLFFIVVGIIMMIIIINR